MDRTQFTFYESFFKAVSRIREPTDRAAAYDAICNYALYGTEPDMEKLDDIVAIAFEGIKPNLKASRRKASNGKLGGQSKKAESKTEAKRKQKCDEQRRDKQDSTKQDKEQDKDKEQMLNPPTPLEGVSPSLASAFADWLKYKAERREGYKPTGLKSLQTQVLNKAREYGDDAVEALIRECMAANYQGIIFDRLRGGRKDGSVDGHPGEGVKYGTWL